MKQGRFTTIIVALLYGAYRAYAAVVAPLTTPQIPPEQQMAAGPETEIKPLSITGRIARTHLGDQPWTTHAKYQWQRGDETFIYFDHQMRIEDDKQNKLRVSPFALVWVDERRADGLAYTLLCDSAVIEFESTLQFGQSNPGRIVWGQLDGDVRITGPDGLLVRGQNFVLNEETQRLHSDYPLTFAYGPQPGKFEQVRGAAEQIDIRLKKTTESLLGHDMPRIGGIERITLRAVRRDVVLDLVMDDHGKPAPVSLRCGNQFTYDVDDLLATFEEDVRVRRATHASTQPEQFDWLRCGRLQLVFAEAPQAVQRRQAQAEPNEGQVIPVSATSPSRERSADLGITLDLEFRRLLAAGEEVLVGSEENRLTARMRELYYDITTRTVEMRDHTGRVAARYRDDELEAPFIQLRHDEDDRIEAAECRGAGRVVRRNPATREIDVESTWTDSLRLGADPETSLDLLEIEGDGRVVQPLQQTGIIADRLLVWLDSETLQSIDGDLRTALAAADAEQGLPVKRVQASSNVALVSPTLHLETQELKAEFHLGSVPATAPREPQTPADGARSGDASDSQQPIVVAAEAVDAQILFDPATEKTDVQQLVASHKVSVSRASAAAEADGGGGGGGEDPFSIEAETLELRRQGGSHVLRLLGRPARIRHPEAEIEGNELYLDRGGNVALVRGAGALSVRVDSDLEGRKLDASEQLCVRWVEQMRFDGQQAKFVGRVRTTLADSNMLSEQMSVSLNRRVAFAEDHPGTQGLEIDRIHCREGVEGEYIEWEGTTLVGIRKVQVAEFVVERGSGDFRAQGPGRIDDWRQGGQRRHVRIDPAAVSGANQSLAADDLPWEYTRVKFVGEMTGNQQDRYVTLNDRVRIMHGPVENPLAMIERDEFSQESQRAKNAVWIGSDVLQVRLVGGDGGAGETITVMARGNAELEGKVFGGRADSISYDELKEMFTFKGLGTEAYMWHQDRPGSDPREATAKTIQFVPSKMQLTLDGVLGISGAR